MVIRFSCSFISRNFNLLDLSLCWGQSHSCSVQICIHLYLELSGFLVKSRTVLMSESVPTRNEIPYLSVVALELVIRTSGTEPILYKN